MRRMPKFISAPTRVEAAGTPPKLIDEYVAVEQAEAQMKSAFVPKLNKALPARKAARYLQIENKIRAVIKYDLAAGVPLVQ